MLLNIIAQTLDGYHTVGEFVSGLELVFARCTSQNQVRQQLGKLWVSENIRLDLKFTRVVELQLRFCVAGRGTRHHGRQTQENV